MFQAIAENDTTTLRNLAADFITAGRNPAALLCLDHVFRVPPRLQVADDDTVVAYLKHFYDYLGLLRSAVADQQAVTRPGIRRLFALTFLEADGTYLCRKGSHLHGVVDKQKWSVLHYTEDGVIMSEAQAAQLIAATLSGCIKVRVAHHELSCGHMKAFSSCCLPYAVLSQCNAAGCNRQHVDPKKLDKRWFSRRVALYLRQILILQVPFSIPFRFPLLTLYRQHRLCFPEEIG
jgi:hypothetical protein